MTRDPRRGGTCLQHRHEESHTKKKSNFMPNSVKIITIGYNNKKGVSVCLSVLSNSVKTNLCGLCLCLLTGRRRCGSSFLQDSVEPHGSWREKM